MILTAIAVSVSVSAVVTMLVMAVLTRDRRMARAHADFSARNPHVCPGHCVNFGPCDTCAPQPENDIEMAYDKESDSWK